MSFVPIIEVKRTFAGPLVSEYWHERGAVFTVTAQVSHLLAGSQPPHFSVTGWARSAGGRELGGGACGEYAVTLWPELEIVERLHLCHATDGAPMGASANASYWFEQWLGIPCGWFDKKAGTPEAVEAGRKYFASHLRISAAEADGVRHRLMAEPRAECAPCDGSGISSHTGLPCVWCGAHGTQGDKEHIARVMPAEVQRHERRWKDEAVTAVRWLLANATDTERAQFRDRCRKYLGHDEALIPSDAPALREATPRTAAHNLPGESFQS